MAVLQATTITGGLTMQGMAAGFMKINAEGAVVMDTNTYLSSGSYLALSGGTVTGATTFSGGFSATGTQDQISSIKFYRLNAGNEVNIDTVGSFILSKTDGSWGSGTKPSGSHNGFGVISLQTHSSGYYTQLGLDTNQNDLWIRSSNGNSAFGSWIRMATRDWVTSLGYITGYSETDTLATVTGRGATTTTETTYYGGLRSRKSQTAGNYTTAALWTESYDNTATGIAFHISGVKGTFLEMRTNQVLYWDGNTVYHSGNLTNLNQLTNGPGYITSSALSGYATRQDGARYTTDFNSILSSGFFNGEGTPSNAPNAYGQLIVAKGIDTGLQIAGGYNSGQLWFRGWGYGPEANGFYAWRRLLNTGADPYPSDMNQYVKTTSSPTFSSNLYISADGSTGYVASRIWLYSHNNYRGAGIYLSGTGSTWFAGTGYTDFDGAYIISRRSVAGDDSTAWSSYRLWQVSSSGNTYQTGNMSASTVTVYSGGDAIGISGAEGRISFRDQALVWTGYVGFRGNLGVIEFPGRNVKINSGYNGTITLETGVSGYNSGLVSIPYGSLNVDNGSITTGGYVYTNYSTRVGEIWGYGGLYRSSGDMLFGTENGGWRFHYQNSQKVYIGTDGNIWMSWLGDYISNRIGQDVRSSASPTFASIYTNGGVSTNGGNNLLGVQSPGGASRANGGSTETGAFKITFPAGIPVYGMFKLVIHIYEYGQRGNGYEIHCGGHMYPNYMYNRFQVQYGSSNSPLNVRYGNDGTYGCIWIGDTNTTWSYPQIWVSEFMMGYSNTSWTTWRSGWSISLVTSYGNSGAMDGPYTCDFGYAANATISSQVNINYNNDSNSTYQLLWGSGNSVYGTAGVYLNPSSDTIYAVSYRGSGNVGGTGEASNHPAGIYSQGTNWLYGTMYLNGNTVYDADSFQLNGRYSIWGRWNTYSGYITKIAYMTFDYNSNNGHEIYHSIASTDINGSYSDAVSLNSYNDITLRLDSNNNNANSYLRISNNSAGDGTIAWIGYESGMNQNYFSGSVGISTGPRTDGYRLNMGGSIHLNGNSVDYVGSLYFNGAGHIQPNAGSYGALQMTSSKNGWSGIRFTDSEVNLMMNSNESGNYRNGYGWQFRWYNGTFYISTSGQGGGSEYTALHSGNYTSWAQQKVYQGQSDGNWQNFTNDVGEFRVDEVLNITSGNHSNHPTGVYTYGGVLSWRLNNHSFQLYASHTGDLTFKTQWGNDNYSGWRRIIHESNISSFALAYGNLTGSFGMNDNKLYLRTNGDTNHYLWNADDDYEELRAYAGTGFRVRSSGGEDLLLVYGASNGGYTYSPYSFRAPIFYDSNDTAYYLNPAGGSRLRNLYVGDSGDDWSDPGGWGTQVRFSNGPHVRFVLHARSPGIEAGMYVHTPGSVYIGSYTSHDVSMMYAGNRKMQITNSYIYTDVYLEAAGSLRAPIFYDSNDTGYYGDFASTSRMNNIMLGSTYSPSYQGQLVLGHTSYNFNFLNGSWASSITAGILANCADEYEFAIHDSGNSVESLFIYQSSTGRILMGRDIGWGTTPIQAAADFRAPIFYDSQDTGYFCDPNSRSRLSSIDYGSSGYYFAAGDWGWRHNTPSGWIQFGPANSGHAHIYTDRSNFYFNVDVMYQNGNRIYGDNYRPYADSAGNADTVDGLHAASFTRKDTSGQYLKAYYEYGNYLTSETPLNLVDQGLGGGGLRVDFMHPSYTGSGGWNHVITWSGYNGYNMYQLGGHYDGGTGTNLWVRSEANHGRTSWTSWRRLLNTSSDPYAANMNQYVRTSDNVSFAQVTASNIYAGGDVRGNDVYTTGGWFRNHTNNNGIYWSSSGFHLYPKDGSDFYVRSGNSDISIQFMAGGGTSRNYIHNASDNAIGFLSTSRSWIFRVDNGGSATVYGDLTCNSLNTGNYINIGYNRNNESVATSAFRGIDFHTTGDFNYYIGKPAGSWTQPLHIHFYTGIRLRSHHSYGGTQFYNIANGVTVATVNDGDNHFRGYYDVIAYASDRRLKQNIKPIEDALNKVKSLTGMTYEWNSVGKQYGWEPGTEREAGVFAQDVEAVLPEAVKLAPFDNDNGSSKSGENFLTVKYEKLVPLLIEAIKEQQKQIDELKEQLKNR